MEILGLKLNILRIILLYHIIFEGIDTKLDSDKQFLKKETLENLLKGVRAHVEMVDSKFYFFMTSVMINKQLQQVNY